MLKDNFSFRLYELLCELNFIILVVFCEDPEIETTSDKCLFCSDTNV